jgi:hypothetical protein
MHESLSKIEVGKGRVFDIEIVIRQEISAELIVFM